MVEMEADLSVLLKVQSFHVVGFEMVEVVMFAACFCRQGCLVVVEVRVKGEEGGLVMVWS